MAVNPFENLPIYSPEDMKRAQNAKINKIFPHVFVTAAIAYNQLMTHSKNQSVLISGESGAGKTETTKKVLSYLAKVAPSLMSNSSDRGIEDKILQSNPLLEALGDNNYFSYSLTRLLTLLTHQVTQRRCATTILPGSVSG